MDEKVHARAVLKMCTELLKLLFGDGLTESGVGWLRSTIESKTALSGRHDWGESVAPPYSRALHTEPTKAAKDVQSG